MQNIENFVESTYYSEIQNPFNQLNIIKSWYRRVHGELRKLCLSSLYGRTVHGQGSQLLLIIDQLQVENKFRFIFLKRWFSTR